MELHEYVRILRRNWMVLLGCTLLGLAAAAAYCLAVTPRFQSTTVLYVSVRTSESAASGDLAQGSTFARQAVTSYVDVATSARVLDTAISQLGLATTAEALSEQITANSPPDTVLIKITVADPDPGLAARIANTVGESLTRVVVDELEKPDGDQPSLVKMQTIQPALVATQPFSPNVPLVLAIGGLMGLGVGFSASILRSILDTRVSTLHDLEVLTHSPMLGGIAFDPDAKRRPLIVTADPQSPRAESFRMLRTNLQFVNVDSGKNTFVITSSAGGEGKSTTVANLAITLAEAGSRVVLVDGDLRMPSIAEYMGLEGAVGLTDVLIGRVEASDVIQTWGRSGLSVLPSGRIPPNPSELLGSAAMSNLLERLGREYDYVLLDAPPMIVADAAVVSQRTNGVILTVALGRVKKAQISHAIKSLDRTGSHLVGVIATMLPIRGADSYGYGYGHGYYEQRQDPPSAESLNAGEALDTEERAESPSPRS